MGNKLADLEEMRRVLMSRPSCFTVTQWEEWSAFAMAAARPSLEDYACTDCLPEFKARMMRCGRCDWPETEFVVVEDGPKSSGIEGRRRIPIMPV